MKEDKSLDSIAGEIYNWVECMGWHNKTPLEYLALISSEVGEAVNECRGKEPTEHLGEELADIVLRVLDFSKVQGIDLEHEIELKLEKNRLNGTRGRVK